MALIAHAIPDSAFLLSIEEARRDAISPEPSVLSLDSSLSRSPIPTSPPCSDDDDSVGMNSLEGNHDDDHKKWYKRIHSPTGPLPYHEADAHNDNAAPYEFDLGMTGNWMCVYDLDNVCLDLDNDNESTDLQDAPVLPRYSHISRCVPVMPIPTVPFSLSPSASAPAIPTGFLPEHLREVFSTGLLPHVIEWFQGSDLAALSSSSSISISAKTTSEPAWNGYLPLVPYSSSLSSSGTPPQDKRRKRRARSEIGKSIIRPRLSPPGEEPSPLQHVTLLAPNSFDEEDVDVELVYSPVCCSIFSITFRFVLILTVFGFIAVCVDYRIPYLEFGSEYNSPFDDY
jgi:hypothetical protein